MLGALGTGAFFIIKKPKPETIVIPKTPHLSEFSIYKPDWRALAENLKKIEVWTIPPGNNIAENDYILVGAMSLKSDSDGSQTWTLPIPKNPILAEQIFASGFDGGGNKVGEIFLPQKGVANIYDAVWAGGPAAGVDKDSAVKNFLSSDAFIKPSFGGKIFVSYSTLGEKTESGYFIEYIFGHAEEYYLKNNTPTKGAEATSFLAVYLRKISSGYAVMGALSPRAGENYEKDLQHIFPADIRAQKIVTDANSRTSKVTSFEKDISYLVKTYFKSPPSEIVK